PTLFRARVRRAGRYRELMRLGVLDVGSNTVHLLVVDARRGAHPWPAHAEKVVLRLADHLDRLGRISPAWVRKLYAAVYYACHADDRQGFEIVSHRWQITAMTQTVMCWGT